MRIFTRMSIRLVLGQIIGVLGFLLVALSTAGLFAAIEHDTAARRVASLTHTPVSSCSGRLSALARSAAQRLRC